jgi:putative transposase
MLKVVEKQEEREAGEEVLLLDEIARRGALRMLMEALKAEADAHVERHRGERDEQGHALVVRNGRAKPRKLTLGAGTVELQAPRVDDRRRDADAERRRFISHILPPYMRRSPKVAEVLPILYLRGPATGDFRPALESLLGEEAAGLSPTNIARLTACWDKEYADFRRCDLTGRGRWPRTSSAATKTNFLRRWPASSRRGAPPHQGGGQLLRRTPGAQVDVHGADSRQ